MVPLDYYTVKNKGIAEFGPIVKAYVLDGMLWYTISKIWSSSASQLSFSRHLFAQNWWAKSHRCEVSIQFSPNELYCAAYFVFLIVQMLAAGGMPK